MTYHISSGAVSQGIVLSYDNMDIYSGGTANETTVNSKGYMYGLRGYSNYKLFGIEASTGKLFFNRRGKDLQRIFKPLQESLDNS